MSEQYPIVGCASTTGVHPRLEIRDLQQKTEQWTLFIHAMADIQLPEHRPKASRFGDLGGIHGLPYERWAGDPSSPDQQPEGTWGGYCNHESVLFPSWHRPYVLAIEQSISGSATRLARRWTKGVDDHCVVTLWKTAAEELRFPFWDWTDKRTGTDGLPDILQPQSFTFTLPNCDTSVLDNPLASYAFGSRLPDGFANRTWTSPLSPSEMSYWQEWKRTYRWPSTRPTPTEDYIKIKHILAGNAEQRGSWEELRCKVAKLYTYPATAAPDRGSTIWKEFSNNKALTKHEKATMKYQYLNLGSLEEPHNSVHLVVGGYGDMADNDYAGFDPIFYLHHANVDRILAFWEYVYNDYWMEDGYRNKSDEIVPFVQKDGTWLIGDNDTINQTSELVPFRTGGDGSNPYWTPNDARFKSSVHKGYTYPDIGDVSIDGPVPPDAETRQKYMSILQEHYGLTPPAIYAPRGVFEGPKAPPGYERVGQYPTFTIIADAVGHAFNGSYYIQLSYGELVIGSIAILSRGAATHCSSCQRRATDGTRTRSIIDIPDDIVIKMIEYIRVDDKNVPMKDIVGHITAGITQKVLGPTGVLLATALPKSPPDPSGYENRQPGSALSDIIAPSVKLISSFAIIAAPSGAAHAPTPIQYTEVDDHGALLTDEKGWTFA